MSRLYKVNIYYKIIMIILSIFFLSNLQAEGPVNTKHNLSVNGLSHIRAFSETKVCIFCHTPHNAFPETPLWNHNLAGNAIGAYGNNKSNPNGSSELCLSCHDGTVALGSIRSRSNPIPMTHNKIELSYTKDILNGHPFSIVFDNKLYLENKGLVNPSTLKNPVKLDKNGKIQCTTCHNPHGGPYKKFLVLESITQLCITCHTPCKNSASSRCEECHTAHSPLKFLLKPLKGRNR